MSYWRVCFALLNTCLLLLPATTATAQLLPPVHRQPQYSAKDARVLLSDEAIALARGYMEQYAEARAIAMGIVSQADVWLGWDDAALRALVTTADVPRAFNVGTAGCPKCGQEIYAHGGTYPWIIDPKRPFTVQCPVDGSVYPSNDFAAHYAAGIPQDAALAGDHADGGRGWVGSTGEKYWFVAYANHWTWQTQIIPAARNLARAYILTGDKRYGRKAAILLDRIAEVYPNMDYHSQSRYGELQAERGSRYEGKILNAIWESNVLTDLAEAYDYSWECIDENTVMGKNAEQVRSNIEANLLEEGIEAYFDNKISGNFGMHQKALVYAGLVRQYGPQKEWFDSLLLDAGADDRRTGFHYALYNLVYRDGTPYETAPGYNFSWVENLTTIADALRRAGYEVHRIPKMRRLYDAVLDVVNIGAHTPAVGDSSSVRGGLVGQYASVYQSAYRAYGDPRYRAHLASFGAVGPSGLRDFDSLFHPLVEPLQTGEAELPPPRSRILDGYGMAILNNPSDSISLSLYYGYRGGHGHYDRLHFDLFAYGMPLTPDTGYPDFMNAYVPGIYTWSKNTIAHNTVTVDASRQQNNQPGAVALFVDAEFARALDVDAAETYDATSMYRRQMLMVDSDETHSYVIDAFSTLGGEQRDYSLHGPIGEFEALGGSWSEPAPGTLAGASVPLGEIYDDAKLAAQDFNGSYASYSGSGFQHLRAVQHLQAGSALVEWRPTANEQARLRIHALSDHQNIMLARAQVSPVKQKDELTYLILRDQGTSTASRFVTLLEPSSKIAPRVASAKSQPLSAGEGVAISVALVDAASSRRDLIVINANAGSTVRLADGSLETDAAFAILRFEGEILRRVWFAGGELLRAGEAGWRHSPRLLGSVTGIDAELNAVFIAAQGTPPNPESLVGHAVHFSNASRRTTHTVVAAELTSQGVRLTLRDDLRVGRLRLDAVATDQLTSSTGLAFAPVYRGRYAASDDLRSIVPVDNVHSGKIQLAEPLSEEAQEHFRAAKDTWILDVGPGDRLSITPVTTLELEAEPYNE